MTRTMGGMLYAVVLRDETLKSGATCVVAEDPRVPGAIGYGDDEEDARDMLEIVRADILARAEQSQTLLEAEITAPQPAPLVSLIIGGWNQILTTPGLTRHA